MFASLKKRYEELQDLREWRDWLIDVLTLIYAFVFPVSLILLFPVYLQREHYLVIAVDIIAWVLMVVRSFIPSLGYRFRSLFWILLIYCLTVTFFLILGPGYARSAWLFSCVIMVAVFFGSRAAIISVMVNTLLLMFLFFIMRERSPVWSAAAADGLMNWISYTLNFSLLSLLASLPVGFLIKRLDIQLVKNRLRKEELQAAMEELEATNEEIEAQNEELLRSSEDMMHKESFIRRIMENAPAAILRISLDNYAIEYANSRAAEISGYTFDEIGEGPRFLDRLIPPEWRQTLREYWETFIRGEGEAYIRYPINHKDGGTRWVEMRNVLVKGPGGVPVAIESFGIDITMQVAADDAVRRSEEKYRSLVENINEVLFSVDERGIVTYVSPGISRFGDYDPKELVGKPFIERIHHDDREILAARFLDLARGNEAPLDYRIVTPVGEVRWVHSSSHAVYRDGKFAGLSGILTDIHERRLAEEKLQRETAFAETVLDTLPGIFFMLDRQGRFVRWKGQARNIKPFGYTAEEIYQMGALDFLEESERVVFSKLLTRVIDEGSGSAEVSVKDKSGEKRVFYLSGSRMDIGGETFVLVIGVNVTDRKRAEEERERAREQLVQAQKMEAVGTLAGGIAHDFNNMLVGIMGGVNMAEMLLREEGPLKKEAILGYLETAVDSSLRAADMTKGLLTLSRRSGLKITSVDMHLSMRHVLNLCKNSLPKTVELDFAIVEEPLMARADPLQIEQVLLNLCVNASHAMTIMRREGERQGGKLRLDTASLRSDADFCALHPEARPGDAYVKIRVSDNGVGMDGETRRHIFDPFFTTKGSGEGTGLGLSMAYSIIKQHNGFIDVYSEPGKGSTFVVYVPAAGGAEELAGEGTGRPGIAAGTGTILVIDDERAILRIARGMLELCGYRVITANSGDEGIVRYHEHAGEINAVLLDYSLLGVSGLEIFKRLLEINPGVRVLLTSGLMEEDIMKKALAQGIGSFIQKPYSIEELSAKIKEVMG